MRLITNESVVKTHENLKNLKCTQCMAPWLWQRKKPQNLKPSIPASHWRYRGGLLEKIPRWMDMPQFYLPTTPATSDSCCLLCFWCFWCSCSAAFCLQMLERIKFQTLPISHRYDVEWRQSYHYGSIMIALPPPDLNLPIYGACMGMNGYVWMHVWMYVCMYGAMVASVRYRLHSKLHSITPVATKVHVILGSFVVLTWMRDTIALV